MSIISKLVESNTVDSSNVEDYNGGGFISESGIYDLIIKRSWVIESSGGAIGMHVEFEGEGMLEKDFWMTNKDQQTFYNKNGKDFAMAGYVDMKKLNYVLTGNFMTSLTQLNVSNQIVKTYEWKEDPENEGKKKKVEIEKEVEYVTDWAGKQVKVGIQMKEKEEQKQQGDKWVGTGKRAENDKGEPYLELDIIGFYNADTNQTANEMKNDKDPEQIEKDKGRIEKSPIRPLKIKKTAPSKSNGGTVSGGVKKPNVF
jgi:hypothetical protein